MNSTIKAPRLISTASGATNLILEGSIGLATQEFVNHHDFDIVTFKDGDWSDLSFLGNCVDKIKGIAILHGQFDWSFLSTLPSLKGLRVGGRFNNTIRFSELKNLESFDTWWNQGYEDNFHGVVHLRSLKVKGYNGRNMKRFASFPRLEYLQLVDCDCASFSGLDVSDELRYLDCHNFPQLKDLSGLAALRYLKFLSIGKCQNLKELSPIGELGSLEELTLFGLRATSLQWIEKLQRLKRLRLDCDIEDGNLEWLTKLPNLRYVGMKNRANFSVKFRDIRSFLTDKGFNQLQEDTSSYRFPGVFEFASQQSL